MSLARHPAYEPVADFAKAAGKRPNLVGYYSGWSEPSRHRSRRGSQAATAPSRSCRSIRPTPSSRASPRVQYDKDYLRPYADSVRDFGHAVVIGFGHEMNGPWYPWGYGHVLPQDVRGGVAAHRDAVPLPRAPTTSPGYGQSTRTGPAPGPSPTGGPARSMSTGSASTATTTVPPTPSPPSSAPPLTRYSSSPASRCSFPRPPSRPGPARLAKITNLFAGMSKYKTLGLVWFDKDQDTGA